MQVIPGALEEVMLEEVFTEAGIPALMPRCFIAAGLADTAIGAAATGAEDTEIDER
jgi:hypothetical protein